VTDIDDIWDDDEDRQQFERRHTTPSATPESVAALSTEDVARQLDGFSIIWDTGVLEVEDPSEMSRRAAALLRAQAAEIARLTAALEAKAQEVSTLEGEVEDYRSSYVDRNDRAEEAEARAAALEAQVQALTKAVEPFCRTQVWEHIDSDEVITRASLYGVKVSAGAFRRAHAVLSEIRAALSPAPAQAQDVPPLVFDYTNWRGETGTRRAIPLRIYHGATEWHPEPQWLLEARDVDKDAVRAFAIKDMRPAQAQDAGAVVAEMARCLEAHAGYWRHAVWPMDFTPLRKQLLDVIAKARAAGLSTDGGERG
jgi:hypothetical protein